MGLWLRSRFGVSRPSVAPIAEALEGRQFLSATPITGLAPTEKLTRVVPVSITAGQTGSLTMTIHNPNTVAETDAFTLSVAPSLDRSTAADAETLGTLSTTVTLKPRGNATLKIPLTIPTDATGGQFYALVTGSIGANAISLSTSSKFMIIGPVVTPSLVGKYVGLIEQERHSGTFGGGNHISELSFILQTDSQTLDSLAGTVAIGTDQTTGTLTGTELSNGKVNYSFASSVMNFTMTGRLVAGGKYIEGNFSGTFTGNLFSSLQGAFKLTLQPATA